MHPRRAANEAISSLNVWRLRRLLDDLRVTDQPEKVLREIRARWRNPSSADPSFLTRLWAETEENDGPVLECGSGLSTIVLAVATDKKGRELWSLEHDPYWYRRTRGYLRRLNLRANLCLAPLVSYEDFAWYGLPQHLPLGFGLVVCDGPPKATRGGRYGLFPVLGERIDGPVLLDDANRESELSVIERWTQEFGVDVEIESDRDEKPFAVLTASSSRGDAPSRIRDQESRGRSPVTRD